MLNFISPTFQQAEVKFQCLKKPEIYKRKIMSEVIVRVKQGQIQGIKETSEFSNAEFYSFYGVPYAEAPVKDLRFKDPVKAQPWKGIRKGTTPRDCFVQYSYYHLRLMGSEDGLYVNIHTPQLPKEGEPLKAVVALIHAGRQVWGSPNPEFHGSPDFIMHHDVVYVTIGFRFNIFGFLNLNMKECSGNQGLKDIVMAFQWIHENIRVFNGDSSNITVIGGSSGAAIIHLLLLSPVCKGLFHKAIIMGQYAFNCLACPCIDQTARALEFAHDLGFQGDDPKKLLKFLKRTSAEVIVLAMHKLEQKLGKDVLQSFIAGPFAETIDSTIIPVSPRLLIPSMQQMPIIFGICEREAAVGFLSNRKENYEKYFNTAIRQNVWGWARNLTDAELDQINNQIHSFYSQHQRSITPLSNKIDIMTDAAYSEVYDTLIDLVSPNYPVYVYKFQYEGEIALNKIVSGLVMAEKVEGTFHFDDMSYWSPKLPPKNEKTREVIRSLTKMWCSFIKTSNPNHENMKTQWRPTTPEKPCYLKIDEEITFIEGKLNGERFEFWDNLKKQFKYD